MFGRYRKLFMLSGSVVGAAVGSSSIVVFSQKGERGSNSSLVMRTRLDGPKTSTGNKDELAFRMRFEDMVLKTQDRICDALEEIDGSEFKEDVWIRPHGGGGRSRVLQDGTVFEKAGVNVSIVHGKLPERAAQMMRSRGHELAKGGSLPFYAAGLSLVVHPHNPMVPTVHLNYRYFYVEDPNTGKGTWWFGGGSDLTPSYLFEDDVEDFHSSLRDACEEHNSEYYPKFKAWCDKYFYIKHRGESRGVGGIFFDDVCSGKDAKENDFAFVRSCSEAFLPTYLEIVKRRQGMPFDEAQKEWQQLRRGRYVEFNLVYDRGTKFGLFTPGARIESILMSLPLTARWQYSHEPKPNTPEHDMLSVLKKPREWAKPTGKLGKEQRRVLVQGASFNELLDEVIRRSSMSPSVAKSPGNDSKES